MRDLQELVDAADVAELLVAVDGLCASRQWDRLADLARRCRDAVELGKQLWPVAMHIDYRLAWEGPPAHAGAVLRPGAAKFALGPLTEVAASTHDWASLAPHIAEPVSAAAVAQERVLRGENLVGQAEQLAELPLVLAEWEPTYALPTYRDRSAEFPAPQAAARQLDHAQQLSPGERLPDDAAARALRDVVETWTAQSSGQVDAVVVAGGAADAVGAVAARAALADITPAEALALLQWAGASGGAYGRRRGGGAGRFAAWWAVASLTGVSWPDDPTEPGFAEQLGEATSRLRWYRWAVPGGDAGWVLRVAVEDTSRGLAWAVNATDRRDDEPLGEQRDDDEVAARFSP